MSREHGSKGKAGLTASCASFAANSSGTRLEGMWSSIMLTDGLTSSCTFVSFGVMFCSGNPTVRVERVLCLGFMIVCRCVASSVCRPASRKPPVCLSSGQYITVELAGKALIFLTSRVHY